MTKIVFLFFLIISSLPVFPSEDDEVYIHVKDQSQFDTVVDEINAGKKKNILLEKGVYYIKSKLHVSKPLRLIGREAIITSQNDIYTRSDAVEYTPTHYVCRLKHPLHEYCLFINESNQIIKVSESVNQVTKVNVVAAIKAENYRPMKGVEVKIPLTDDIKVLANKIFDKAYGYFDCGWNKIAVHVISTDKEYLNCCTLESCNTPDFNYDSIFYHQAIRYVIYNAEPTPESIYYTNEKIYIPLSNSRVECIDGNIFGSNKQLEVSTSDSIDFKDILFKNFNGLRIDVKDKGSCKFEGCSFENTLSYALVISNNGKKKNKIMVQGCTFRYCSLVDKNIFAYYGDNTNGVLEFHDNHISRYPDGHIMYKNASPAVRITGDATLSRNTIFNTCRDHIFLNYGNIVVSENFCYNDDHFYDNKLRNCSSDWGIIYCNHIFSDTQKALENNSHKITLKNNLLYGARSYGNDGRGIFIDDGRGDVICENNVILNSQMYSIDSRNVKLLDASSVRNRYEKNIVDTRYRLASGPSVNGVNLPITKGNILLGTFKNVSTKVNIEESDRYINVDASSFCVDGKIYIKKNLIKQLKKLKVGDYKFNYFEIK